MALQKADYLSRDYTGFRTSLLQYAQSVFPEWQPASEGDFGMVMVELFSYMGDILSYYTDRAQFENYLPTATQRESILNLAFMLGYVPNSGSPARGTVDLTTVADSVETVVPAGLKITTNRVAALDGPVTFETTEPVTLPANPTGAALPVSVSVEEGTTESGKYLGASSGQPGQAFSLPNTGVYREATRIFVEDVTGSIQITPEGGGPPVNVREWLQVDRILGRDKADRVFESRISTTVTNVFFGDDVNGAIPATGLKIYATYRHGVGALGNVATGVVRMINTTGTSGLSAVRVAQNTSGEYLSGPMTGGADPESDESIRENAPRSFRSQDRVVTVDDYKSVALGTPGVRTVNAVVGSFTSVTLYITGPDGGAPTTELQQAVLDRLSTRLLAGVTVTIATPTFVPIDVGTVTYPMLVLLKKGYTPATVEEAVKREIAKMFSEMDAGDPMSVGNVYEVVNNIDGVDTVDIKVITRQGAGGQTTTAMITPQPWEVFTLGNIVQTVTA